ncbi:hypothetical protein QVD17_29283 [Tagetes erecta]|uniref:Peptidase A1 domain-containing protein n=1 Tax=Tagetes erecta TaxID=13708 RepID=A0AAD8KEI4_TARER|nr:hypothetical protein QVD17_29283 [Tagetes erecta]
MHLIIILIFFILVSFSHQQLFAPAPFNTTVTPVMKDANTYLHKVSWLTWVGRGESSYLIDLDAPFTWQDCIVGKSTYDQFCLLEEGCLSPLRCDDSFCKEAQSYVNPICPSRNITSKYGCTICTVTPFNPVSKSCKLSQLTISSMHMYLTDGRNPFYDQLPPDIGTTFAQSCAPSSLLRSLPKNVNGVVALSWSSLAFPRQLSFPNVADKFAICLSSSSSVTATGVIFLGDGPFYFTQFPNLDLRTILSYTPMVRKRSKSLGYYIKINGITIKGTRIHLKTKSMKLSSVVPYTTLRSDIYKALVTAFSKATRNIPRVDAIKPFSLCLKASAIGSVRTGFLVPDIDLDTESGKVWRISGDNTMKQTTNDAACLAFIDGGTGAKDAIVMGTFQMENNFLFLDLENQKLGFSSSLLARGTSCSSFNFTVA